MWLDSARGSEAQVLRAELERAGFDPAGRVVMMLESTGDLAEVSVRAAGGDQVLVVTTARSPLIDPWEVLAVGGADLVVWRTGDDAAAVLARLDLWRTVDRVVCGDAVTGVLRGESPALRQALRQLVLAVTGSSAPILLVGETGTGKELAARVAHVVSRETAAAPFVVLDCTTIVPTLSGSELFGHERGAFTGAVSSRAGAAAAANGGTLFLDEIGELPLELQAALLRLIQEGSYKRVGGDAWLRTRVRLVAATNRDLIGEQDAGRFRPDLYHRLAAATVVLPPLRHRSDDIVPLFRWFLAAAGVPEPVELEPAVADWLAARPYPGNVRDLRQLADRVAARHRWPGPVTVGEIPPDDRPPAATLGARSAVPGGRGTGAGDMAGETEGPAPEGPGSEGGPGEGDAGAGDDLAGAVEQAVLRGTGLQRLKDDVATLAVDAALRVEQGNVRAAARRLQVTERAVQLRRAASRGGNTGPDRDRTHRP